MHYCQFEKGTDMPYRMRTDALIECAKNHGCKVVRRRLWQIVLISVLITLSMSPTPHAYGASNAGTGLSATVSLSSHLTSTYTWTIRKSASPKVQTVSVGSTPSVTYTITTTKSGTGTIDAYFDGRVCVVNTGRASTQGLSITDRLSIPGRTGTIGSVVVDTGGSPVLAAGSSWCYPYKISVPSRSIAPGATYKDTANVTITNYSGMLGLPEGPSPSASGQLPSSPTVLHSSITVNDSDGESFTFTSGGTDSYGERFPCVTSAGVHTIVHNDTATIQSTGQSASAEITVHCGYQPTITSQLSATTITPDGSIQDVATVSGASPGTMVSATEYVSFTFYRGSDASACVPSNSVGSVLGDWDQATLNGGWFTDNGINTLEQPWPVGTYEVQVTYAGDADNAPASTPCGAESFTVSST